MNKEKLYRVCVKEAHDKIVELGMEDYDKYAIQDFIWAYFTRVANGESKEEVMAELIDKL